MVNAGTELDRYRQRRHLVAGWLAIADLELFRVVDTMQCARGISGDLLEIGVYHGKSAIALGWLRHEGEELVLCDLFDHAPDVASNLDESTTWYQGLSVDDFLRQWRRFHADRPTIHQCDSRSLADRIEPGRFRFAHIDGAHVQEIVEHDLSTALAATSDGAVIAIDDYRTPGLPGVAAAVWPRVHDGSLLPVLFTNGKLWAVRGDDGATADALKTATSAAFTTRVVDLQGVRALWVVESRPASDRILAGAGRVVRAGKRRAARGRRRHGRF